MELHGLINIDKPPGLTSHDVVGKIRRILGTRRVGHAGTLDPAATGVIVVGVGRATRFLDYVQSGAKAYVAHVVMGRESESADVEGRLVDSIELHSDDSPDLVQIEQALLPFVGEFVQVPPKFSAVKLGGEPLYRLARRGEHVDVPVRTVRIDSIRVIAYQYPDLILDVECGSGVYIRSLARDIGEQLGASAYLHHLVRTRVGGFTLESSLSLSELEHLPFPESWSTVSTSVDSGLNFLPACFLNAERTAAWYHGRSILGPPIASQRYESVIRGFSETGAFAGLGTLETHDSQTMLRPKIVLPRN